MHTRFLGRVNYADTYAAMQTYTEDRLNGNVDENSPLSTPYGHNTLWICEHDAVFTQGLAGKAEHIFNPANIPVVQTNRGGQVTFHGPGQVVAYPLVDLKRAGYFVKEYVYKIEESVLKTLLHFGITGHRLAGAPGIYVRLDDPFGHSPLAQRPMKKELGSEPNYPVHSSPDSASPKTKQLGSDPNSLDFTGLGKIAALGIKVSRHCTYHGVALNVAMDLEPFSRINPCGYAGLQTIDMATLGVQAGWDEVAQVLADKLTRYLAA